MSWGGLVYQLNERSCVIIILSKMSQHQQFENQGYVLLENPSADFGIKLFSYQNEDEFQEEQKNPAPTPKKKGRPKGLKTTKLKPETKDQCSKSSKNSGHWMKEENKRYHWFLQIHSNHFIQRHLRRMDKIFKTMADFIGSRQAEQCRSHHQKMQKKYQTFFKIIKSLRYEFYSSSDPINVRLDLEGNNIFQFDPLISQQSLEGEKEPVVGVGSENKEQSVQLELELEKACPSNRHFFLGDNYESGLNYGNF